MEIKGIFFDLYGTLLVCEDLDRAWNRWQNTFLEALNAHGASLDHKRFAEITSEFFSEPMITRINGLSPYESRIKEVSHRLGVDLNDGDLGDIAQATVAAWNENIYLDPEALPLLQEIRRSRKTALISNFDYPPYVRRLLDRHGLDGLFDHITISGEIGVEKPDPAVFRPALEATGLDPTATVYIGDSDVDITGSRRAGMIPIRIVRDHSVENMPEAYEIDSLERIPELVAAIQDAETADAALSSGEY